MRARIGKVMRLPWRVGRRQWALAGVLIAYAAAAGLADLQRRYAGFRGETYVDIARGSSSREIARLLAAHGVIRDEWQFLFVRTVRRRAVLQAGEYRFDRPASVWEVFDRLVRGDVYYHLLRVPEGSNMFEIAEIAERAGLFAREEFLAAARDASLIRDLAPQAPTLEGYLFPATYAVRRRTSARELCEMMTAKFREVWREAGGAGDVHAVVTLASLVEKETSVGEERPLVASVFRNRLERRMALQCDPTTIYAALLDGRYRGSIYRSDLDRPHPYNTYAVAGLPPGPIANPGRASLEAALRPAETDYLYFVAKGDGSGAHTFSTTLEAHNRAVAQFRNGERKALRQGPAR